MDRAELGRLSVGLFRVFHTASICRAFETAPRRMPRLTAPPFCAEGGRLPQPALRIDLWTRNACHPEVTRALNSGVTSKGGDELHELQSVWACNLPGQLDRTWHDQALIHCTLPLDNKRSLPDGWHDFRNHQGEVSSQGGGEHETLSTSNVVQMRSEAGLWCRLCSRGPPTRLPAPNMPRHLLVFLPTKRPSACSRWASPMLGTSATRRRPHVTCQSPCAP